MRVVIDARRLDYPLRDILNAAKKLLAEVEKADK